MLDISETQHVKSSAGQGHWLVNPLLCLLKGCIQVQRRGHLWVSKKEKIVCCQLQTPCFSENKKTEKITQNIRKSLSDALLMWYFQILATDAAIENSASCGFFSTHSVKKSEQLIPDSY